MLLPGRLFRCAAIVVSLAFVPTPVMAQDASRGITGAPGRLDLRLPTIVASTAAAADWASTYHALKHYKVREMNPILRPFDHSPAQVVWIGAAIDAGLVGAWHMGLGKNHPKITAAGLWGMSAFRAYLTIHNIRNQRKAERR
jgi:hypothetical protein